MVESIEYIRDTKEDIEYISDIEDVIFTIEAVDSIGNFYVECKNGDITLYIDGKKFKTFRVRTGDNWMSHYAISYKLEYWHNPNSVCIRFVKI